MTRSTAPEPPDPPARFGDDEDEFDDEFDDDFGDDEDDDADDDQDDDGDPGEPETWQVRA